MRQSIRSRWRAGLASFCWALALTASASAGPALESGRPEDRPIASCPTAAATFYVDFAEGDDRNDGRSPETPFTHCPGNAEATGNAGSTILEPGQRVVFKGGVVYGATLRILAAGEPGRPVVYDGNSRGLWGRGRAIIDGAHERQFGIRGPGKGQAKLRHVVIDHFEIRNLRHVYPDFTGRDPRGIQLSDAEHVEIRNCRLHAINRPAKPIVKQQGGRDRVRTTEHTLSDAQVDLGAYASAPGAHATHEVHLFWNNGAMKVASDYNHVYGYVGERAEAPRAVRIYRDMELTSPGWQGSRQHLPLPAQIGYDGRPAGDLRLYYVFSLKAGNFNEYGGFAMSLGGRDISVHHCEMGDAEFGIAAGGRDIDVHHNDFFAVTAALIGGADQMRFHDNRVRDASRFATAFGYHFNAIHLWAFKRGKRWDPIEGFQCYNNTFLWDTGGTSVIYLEGNIQAPKIHHNVIINVGGQESNEPSGYIYLAGKGHLPDDVSDGEIYNNLVVGLGGKCPILVRDRTKGVKIANNILVNHRYGFAGRNNLFAGYKGYGRRDLERALSKEGIAGRASLEIDDLGKVFVDPARLDYRPRKGSSAIDAGTDVGLKVDIRGTPIPQGKAPDIGPYEYREVVGDTGFEPVTSSL